MKHKHSPEYYRDQVYTLTNLPTTPVIATEILKITREDKLSIYQMLPIIKKDPPMALKILKIANSAYYGLREKIESLRQAIVVIGMRELSHLVLSFSVMKLLMSRGDSSGYFEWKQLWKHSVACGHIAQMIDKYLKLTIPSNPYSLGLLHDIGKLILFRIEPDRYIEAIQLVKKENITASEAETEIFGISHSDVGEWLAERWELPKAIVYAIGYHHKPEQVPDTEYQICTSLVQIADLVCNLTSIQFGTEFVQSIPREEEGWKIIQKKYESFKDLDFERFVLSIDDEIETINKLVELTRM